MYYHHQTYSYNQNDAYRRRHHHQNPSYYDQNYHAYLHQYPIYYHDENYAYFHQNPSYYDQNYYAYLHQYPSYYDPNYGYLHENPIYYHQNYARHHHHQHHHRNPSYDQIPLHHHHHHHHHQYHQNRFYDQIPHHQIEALHCSASNLTRFLVSKEKAKASVVDVPVDVLIQILARLPAKTLLKFRCVCKSWNPLIQQDHYFISLHQQLHLNNNKKKSPSLVTYLRKGFYGIINYWSSSSDSTPPCEIEFNRSEDPPRSMTNSCNGLLGLYNSHSFFIVNPTIRKLRPLPRTPTPCPFSFAALGFDASTGVYKVVNIFEREKEGFVPVRFGCEVYYLGGSDGWKLIDEPPVQPSYTSLPVVVDGAILWASEMTWKMHPEVVALSFDLREEKFSVILHPEGSARRNCFKSHVFASRGCICVADDTIEHMNIWLLMKDDKKKKNSNKWVKQHVIDMAQKRSICNAQPLATDHNGRIVISWGGGRKDYYDPRTGNFDKHELDAATNDVYVEEHVTPYTESMVWPWRRLCGVE